MRNSESKSVEWYLADRDGTREWLYGYFWKCVSVTSIIHVL
jgi:hypothetical protein